MKERPILFSGEMVRAILEGRKTQTRRKMKPRPPSGVPDGVYCNPYNGNFEHFTFWTRDNKMCNGLTGNVKIKGQKTCHWKCPYGVPGDRLWVRETSAIHHRFKTQLYRADGEWYDDAPGYGKWNPNWTPSIHMPRRASRITLEIVNVTVERLNDIREKDAIREGVLSVSDPDMKENWGAGFAKACFRKLWESFNGPGSWEKNPWVWVVEFKRIA